MDPTAYAGREQALVKHYVLENYLEQLAFKIGQHQPGTTLNYVDAFSGPWDSQRSDFSDSSPWIALRKLGSVRDELRSRQPPIPLTVRALFIERNLSAFDRLQQVRGQFADVPSEGLRGDFADHVPQAVAFARGGTRPFGFSFIDPTGWTGLPMTGIEPLLRVAPGEVLINFMLGHILRFIDNEDPATRESFDDLFGQGAKEYLKLWKGLEGLDREDAIVSAYADRIREVGGFTFAGSTVVLNPLKDRTQYHLVYATRSLQGMKTFREVEARAFAKQQDLRADAKQQRRQNRSGQSEMFAAEVLDTPHAEMLLQRYQGRARVELEAQFQPGRTVPYDDLLGRGLRFPLTSESTLKGWLKALVADGIIEYVKLGPKDRVPKIGRGHCVRRT